MYLSRVEMTGFKSFADKTVIDFDKGLTAVVGPNGSGKSNLSEAIRWVLGEQSAKSLRGSKMEDVIFNGTQERKAVNFAKVTLVLNNEDRYLDYDFSEISITRSYNRKGESAYYINNEQVRLKDIVDLLMDSGLGKNSFAMISQGKVESIFLSKPEERRIIFEEAAGVQKYQFRKQEASRKLDRSQDHLARVRDIIYELKGQLKPLERQRDIALQYQGLKARLEELEISYAAYRLESDRRAWQEIKEQLHIIQTNLAHTLESVERDKHLQEEIEQAYQVLLLEIDKENQSLQEQHRLVEQEKTHIAIKEQELVYSQTSAQDRLTYYKEQVSQLNQVHAQLDQANDRLKVLDKEREDLKLSQNQIENEKQFYQGHSHQEEADFREELITYYQEEARAHNQVLYYQQVIQQGQAQLKRVTQGQSEHAELETSLKKIIQENKQNLVEVNQMLEQSQVELENSLQAWRKNQEDKQVIQSQIFQLDRQYAELVSKEESLRLMQAQYEGYYGGVKAVMKARKRLSGIVGPIADLISVSPDNQIAIDTALGSALQHIVVTDDRSARQAIAYLKDTKAGRATFLPLTNIKGRQNDAKILEQASQNSDFIGVAADLVKVESTYNVVISHLLGTTLVMKSTQAAQELARQLRFSTRIVTLDGELLTPGGAITGGRQSRAGNSMLSRQTELNQVQTHLEVVRVEKEKLDIQWQALEEAEGKIRQEGEGKRQAVTLAEDKKNTIHHTLDQAQTRLSVIEKQSVTWQSESMTLQKQIMQAEIDLAASQSHEKEMKQKIKSGNQLLESLSQSQEEKAQGLQKLEEKLSDIRTKLALNQQEFKQTKLERSQLEDKVVQIQAVIEHFEVKKTSTEENQGQLKAELEKLQLQLQLQEEKREQIQNQVDDSIKKRQSLQERLSLLDKQVDEGQASLQGAYQKEARLQSKIERLEENMDYQLLYLSQEYHLTFEAAQEQAQDLGDWEKVSQEIKKLKLTINHLGPINMEAIGAYEELFQRYTYLEDQEADLLAAMAQLQETMNQMDEEVIQRFSSSFNRINQQFQKTFKSLFGGGQASLELTDPNNLLTTGVDIIAQPPGKRKQNLALLSGGERAFTAIALLFAILETKPVPFCILDEVEAALDDANVWRYGEYLQHFAQATQFIVVTHRKGTMEHADVLYGVTMEKSGISKLASVRLSEVEETL